MISLSRLENIFSITLILYFTFADGKQQTAPTHGKLSTNFMLTVQGASEAGMMTYNITNNVGTTIVNGETFHTVAYYTQVMGNPPIVRWFDLVGVSEDGTNFVIGYIGCTPPPTTDPVVTSLWEEDYHHTLNSDYPLSGNTACEFTDLSNEPSYTFPVDFPALYGLPEFVNTTGIVITGEEVYLDNRTGWMIVENQNYTIIPISTVDCYDCGQNCIECPPAPWYEIHFIYYSEPLEQTAFGIFYIYPYNQTFVQLNYTIALPTLATPAINFKATWTGTVNDGFATDMFSEARKRNSLTNKYQK